jgi:hypothetical protein
MTGNSRFARYMAASLVFGSLCFGATAVADDVQPFDPNNGFGPNDRPAFLLVSVSQTFDVPNLSDFSEETLRAQADTLGSQVVRVTLGNYVAGGGIKTTRFAGLGQVSIDLSDVPPDPGTALPPNFDGHQYTIVGSFRTQDPDDTIHMMTPYPGVISPQVQQAFFNASAFFDDPEALPKYPTTVQMALFVYDHQSEAGASIPDILDAMFVADPPPGLVLAGASPSEGEGTIFPHHPDADGLFEFHSTFDAEAGTVDVSICLPIPVDIKPGNSQNPVNAGAEGVVPIAVLTTDDFDAVAELDPSKFAAVRLDGHDNVVKSVPALRWTLTDVDGDGRRDILFMFSVPAMTAGANAPLSTASTTVHFRGETKSGMCVDGADHVRFVPARH